MGLFKAHHFINPMGGGGRNSNIILSLQADIWQPVLFPYCSLALTLLAPHVIHFNLYYSWIIIYFKYFQKSWLCAQSSVVGTGASSVPKCSLLLPPMTLFKGRKTGKLLGSLTMFRYQLLVAVLVSIPQSCLQQQYSSLQCFWQVHKGSINRLSTRWFFKN